MLNLITQNHQPEYTNLQRPYFPATPRFKPMDVMCRVGILEMFGWMHKAFMKHHLNERQTSIYCLITLSLKPFRRHFKELEPLCIEYLGQYKSQTLLRVLHKIYHQNSRGVDTLSGPRMERRNILGYPKKPKQSDRNWLWKQCMITVVEWSQYPKESYNSISTPVLHSKQNSKKTKLICP